MGQSKSKYFAPTICGLNMSHYRSFTQKYVPCFCWGRGSQVYGLLHLSVFLWSPHLRKLPHLIGPMYLYSIYSRLTALIDEPLCQAFLVWVHGPFRYCTKREGYDRQSLTGCLWVGTVLGIRVLSHWGLRFDSRHGGGGAPQKSPASCDEI